MASLKQMRGKYYSRIRQWNGVKQIERLIPLKTSNKTDTRIRQAQIEKVERDIKDEIEYDSPSLKHLIIDTKNIRTNAIRDTDDRSFLNAPQQIDS